MPLYECRCERCELTFEVLAPLSSSGLKSRPCPQCGRAARRIISAVAFTVEGGTRAGAVPDVTQLKVPPPARLCWMDDRSAARYAAYKHGRGAEYDDKMHEREERGKKRGDPHAKTAASTHQYGHAHAPAGRKAKAAKSALKAD
ncbi:MAG TPA: zinc ribbon domain-containing protein [Candidatus Binataceae bacterium]|nr:zinc ribbon domain-containing protein [Candidatus Binataceae bacterium]